MRHNKIKKLLTVLSKATTVVGLVVVMSAVAFSVPVAIAQVYKTTAPEWNTGCITQPDKCHPFEQNWFQVGNSTQNPGGAYSTSVTAKPGDVLSFRVYMHNNTCRENDGKDNTQERCAATIAHNAFVKVNLPSTGGTVTATIGSDETASNVSRTVTVNLPAGQTISYKAGSTQSIHNKFDIEKFWPMPNTPQTDNQENGITTSGITQGDIHGSYTWSRYVVFQAQVSNVSAPAVLGTTAKVLPSTGPETAPILALIGMIPTGIMLRRFKV